MENRSRSNLSVNARSSLPSSFPSLRGLPCHHMQPSVFHRAAGICDRCRGPLDVSVSKAGGSRSDANLGEVVSAGQLAETSSSTRYPSIEIGNPWPERGGARGRV